MAHKGRFAKMRLIPEDEYERIKQKIVKEYDPRLAAMVSSSDQSVLSSRLPTDPSQLKFQLTQYQHAMDTFKTLKNNKHVNALPEIKHDLPILPPMAAAPLPAVAAPPLHLAQATQHLPSADQAALDASFQPEEAGAAEADSPMMGIAGNPVFMLALGAVPAAFKRKAEQSLEFIKMHPNKINVNNELELIVNGKPQPGTNFIDLFASLYKAPSSKKSSVLPNFHTQFRSLLSEINMPNTFLPPKAQTGKGFPPGRQPHILHVYK